MGERISTTCLCPYGQLIVIKAYNSYHYLPLPTCVPSFKKLSKCIHESNQLTIMCKTRGERRLISIRYQKECMESKLVNLVISCRMMHNLVKIYHVVQEL